MSIKRILKNLFRLLPVGVLILSVLSADVSAMPIPYWTQTSQADFASGTLDDVDIASSPGDIILANDGPGSFYALRGNNTNDFWRYGIAENNWTDAHDFSTNVKWGGALAYDGGSSIYAFRGNNSSSFYRFNISSNTWTAMPSAPGTVKEGGALTYNNGYVYAMRGNSSQQFWRFNIAANSWETLANTIDVIYQGGALTDDDANYIYAFQCDDTNAFYRYDIAANTWTLMAPVPGVVGFGAALTYDGGNYVYGLRGNNSRDFWRYDISLDSWTVMAYIPYYIFPYSFPTVDWGGSLSYSGSYVYALLGHNSQYFMRYDTGTNTWAALDLTSSTVGYGGALTAGPAVYKTAGTFTSASYDTGYPADFQQISWDAALPAGTAVAFQIAVNDDDSTWDFVGPDGTGSTYYTASDTDIWSGHDGGRYIKYKVYLTTSDVSQTPFLNDITITYFELTIAPGGTTSPASSVEETEATLNGIVDDDGGDVCQYAFEWGINPGVYTANTTWTGSVFSGDAITAGITGLDQGTAYYYRTLLKNSAGTGAGDEVVFLTKPEAPVTLMAAVMDGTQVDLDWTKGTGAVNTKILRKTGDYPVDYTDGEEVYFGPGTGVSDTGLLPGTTYYYRAWSEASAGSLQQWSDEYKSVSAVTEALPSAATAAPDLVEETTATLYGSVVYDIGEACEYRFVYGTASGGPYPYDTGWTGSVTSGDVFSYDVTGLANGTKYYYQAQVRNSFGTGSGGEVDFLTKPERPEDVIVTVDEVGATSITLIWVKGEGAEKTLIRRQTGGYPVDREDGVFVYFDTGTSCIDTGLDPDTVYYYRLWSQVSGSEQWSDASQELTVQTSSLTPTPTPTPTPTATPTDTPLSVGGTAYPVNKMEIVAPWVMGFCGLALAAAAIVLRLGKQKRKR